MAEQTTGQVEKQVQEYERCLVVFEQALRDRALIARPAVAALDGTAAYLVMLHTRAVVW